MRKYRIYYALLLVFLLGCSFWTANPLLLICTGIWIVLPFLLKLSLIRIAHHIQLSCQVRSAGLVGKNNCIHVQISNVYPLPFAGMIHLRVHYYNALFRLEIEEEYQLACINGTVQCDSFLLRDMCGRVEISCAEVVCMDLLGLCKAEIDGFEPCETVIYPGRHTVTLQSPLQRIGHTTGDQVYLNTKGNDPGEVFDLRGYTPGDDIRSIHWKLSEKTDELIVRENSEASHTRHALLVDVPFFLEDGSPSTAQVSDALGLAAALGSQFIQLNIPHQAIFATDSQLYTGTIITQQDQYRRLQAWLELPLPEEHGVGLNLYAAQGWSRQFARLYYITAGSIPKNPLLSGQYDITVICVVEEGDRVQVSTRNRCQLMLVPSSCLYNHDFSLFV